MCSICKNLKFKKIKVLAIELGMIIIITGIACRGVTDNNKTRLSISSLNPPENSTVTYGDIINFTVDYTTGWSKSSLKIGIIGRIDGSADILDERFFSKNQGNLTFNITVPYYDSSKFKNPLQVRISLYEDGSVLSWLKEEVHLTYSYNFPKVDLSIASINPPENTVISADVPITVTINYAITDSIKNSDNDHLSMVLHEPSHEF